MNSIHHLLDDHEVFLQRKRYDRKSLSSPENEDELIKKLRRFFAPPRRPQPCGFQFDIHGYFEGIQEERTSVQYTFQYRLRQNDTQFRLDMEHLTVTCQGETKCYELQSNEDLPSATAVYEDFKCQITGLTKQIHEITTNDHNNQQIEHPFTKLYEQQIDLLKEKGYGASLAGQALTDVALYGDLLIKFLHAYQKGQKTSQSSLFHITKTAFIDQKQIKFVLNYLYDPKNEDLSLRWLYVTVNGVGREFYLKTKKDLPLILEAYKQTIGIYNRHPQKKKDDFQQSVAQHKMLLAEKGYDQIGLNNHSSIDQFMEKFKGALKESLFKHKHLLNYNIPINFEVDTVGFFNNKSQEITFRFNYEFDTKNIAFRLHCIKAEMETVKTFYPKDPNDLPHSAEVCRQFVEDVRVVHDIVPYLEERHGLNPSYDNRSYAEALLFDTPYFQYVF